MVCGGCSWSTRVGSGTGQAVELVEPVQREAQPPSAVAAERRESDLSLGLPERLSRVTLGLRPEGELTAPERAKMDVADRRQQGQEDKEGIREGWAWGERLAEPRAQGGQREIKGAIVAAGLRWLVARHRAEASPWCPQPAQKRLGGHMG